MCLILNLNLIAILYIIFIYILHLHICSLCYLLSTCSLHLLSLYLSFLQCMYLSFNYIFVNAVIIHIWYCLCCLSYCIWHFVYDCYIWYSSSLLMRSFIIFHIWLLSFNILYHLHTYSYVTFSLYWYLIIILLICSLWWSLH